MSLSDTQMTMPVMPANSNNNGFGGFGGDGAWWIIILFLFVFCGWGGNWGNNGRGNGGGVADNYVLASDFSNIERKIDGVNNGLCDGFYATAQQINGVNNAMAQGFANAELARCNAQSALMAQLYAMSTQNANCCCEIREGIQGVNYNLATQANTVSREIERGFCDTNYNTQSQHFQTMQAIDKVGDRVIDYMAQREAQSLRDENQALRLAASQAAQNNYLVAQLKPPCPVPAYNVPNPFNSCGCSFNGCCA